LKEEGCQNYDPAKKGNQKASYAKRIPLATSSSPTLKLYSILLVNLKGKSRLNTNPCS
jgi:hypothetical protein